MTIESYHIKPRSDVTCIPYIVADIDVRMMTYIKRIIYLVYFHIFHHYINKRFGLFWFYIVVMTIYKFLVAKY